MVRLMPAIEILQVMTTTDSRAEADFFARALIETRLAACVQIDGPIQSTYWWCGRIRKDREWRLTIKTSANRYEELAAFIVKHNSYATPEILAIPIACGQDDYTQWLADETDITKI